MITILKDGDPKKWADIRVHKCRNCGCVFKYELNKDTQYCETNFNKGVKCPFCDKFEGIGFLFWKDKKYKGEN